MLQTCRLAGDIQRQHSAAIPDVEEAESAVLDPVVPPPTALQWAPSGYCHTIWGQQHPDFEKTTAKRAVWSIAEKEWIQRWIQAHPGRETGGYAKCLQDIRADPSARCLFHPLHVLDSSRIRSGFEAAMKD